MRLIHKMMISILLTILAILLDVYIVSRVFEIKDVDMAMLVGDTLICIYIVCFFYIEEKIVWTKY